jgi:hypothetical protein
LGSEKEAENQVNFSKDRLLNKPDEWLVQAKQDKIELLHLRQASINWKYGHDVFIHA